MWELLWHFLAGTVLLLYLASTYRRRARRVSCDGTRSVVLHEHDQHAETTSVPAFEPWGALEKNLQLSMQKTSFSEPKQISLSSEDGNESVGGLVSSFEKLYTTASGSDSRDTTTGIGILGKGLEDHLRRDTCDEICIANKRYRGELREREEERGYENDDDGTGEKTGKFIADEGCEEVTAYKYLDGVKSEYSDEEVGYEYSEEGLGDENSEESLGDENSEEGLGDENSEEGLGDENSEEGLGDENSEEGLGDENSEEGLGDENSEDGFEEGSLEEKSFEEALEEEEAGSSEEALEEEEAGSSEEALEEEEAGSSEEALEEEEAGSSEEALEEEEAGSSEEALEEEEAGSSEEALEEEEAGSSEEALEEEEAGSSEEAIEDASPEEDLSESNWNYKNFFVKRELSSEVPCENIFIKPHKITRGGPVSFLEELTARQRELCKRNKLGNYVNADAEPDKILVQHHKVSPTPVPFLEELRLRQKALRHVNREAEGEDSDSQVSCSQAFPAEKDDVVGGVSILADRKEKLDAAKQGWKKRVEPTDAVQFSVAGKMKLENKTANEPLSLPQQNGERKHRVPQRSRFRIKMAELKEISSTPSSPQKEITPVLKRSNSAPGGDDDASSDQETVLNGSKVAVPRADDETFTAFFRSLSTEQPEKDQLEINDEDLDLVISKSSQLSVQKRTVKVQRRHVASRNPIKALASRVDIQEEYVEMRTGVAEKELRRLNVEKLAKNSSFAVEALAGLASKEDFTSVALKKALPNSSAMLPYRELMLLQVKGRRHVQTRLVEPSPSSINSGDSYVLVTPDEVFHWVGTYANVIERSRGAEVALHVQQKRDLGYRGTGGVITIYEEKVGSYSCSVSKKFWRYLGGSENSRAVKAGHPDEDELYESSIIDTNVVYEVDDEELVPVDAYIGSIPKIEMLDPSKILVFDFGSELYVWNGKTAPLERRRVAQSLGRYLWAEGFNYSECDVCPVTVAQTLGCRRQMPDSSLLVGDSRPEWALLAKVTQHMETILFREKFLDWPDFTRVIRSKDYEDTDKQVDASIDISPCDAKKMLEENCNYPDLVLEGSHLARGHTYYDEETHRHFEISTQGVTMWHIMEFESAQLPTSSLGQFHSADSYVVRWTYSITVTGRELNGQPSRHSMAGRDRCAYFCWQGSEASLNEQGAAALLTVELDHERGPQVRVVQGAEPPAFLRLFQGAMIVHSGLRESEHVNHRKGWRLYVCRGEHRQEAALVQVTCSVRSLRSRASFILVKTATGTVYVWHGAKTQPHTQKTAISAAEHLKKKPLEMEFLLEAEITITVQHEGSESRDFFAALGGSNTQLYVSLQKENHAYDYTPRLFHLSSISGTFSATEVLSLLRDGDTVVAYPFLQTDLYSASQPALFLLDNHHELWLWQGWWPDCGEENSLENSFVRGSRAVLWQVERRAAMQTALNYWQLKYGSAAPRAYLVWAGLEPLHFTNLFPTWTDRDDVAELNISDGRKPGELLTVEAELARLTCSTYPAAQLLQRPLPDGVDPTRLELYLDPSHFQELLGMTKEQFFELPLWKQTNLKKEVGLF